MVKNSLGSSLGVASIPEDSPKVRHGLWDRATQLPRLWWRRSGNPGVPNKINNLEDHWTILSWSSLCWSYSSHLITKPITISCTPKTSLLLASPAFFWMSLAVIPASWKEEAAKVGFCKSVTRPCGCMICMYMYQYIYISLWYDICKYIYIYIYHIMYPLHVCMYVWMDGWMDGCMDGWMDGWTDGWMDVCMHACIDMITNYLHVHQHHGNMMHLVISCSTSPTSCPWQHKTSRRCPRRCHASRTSASRLRHEMMWFTSIEWE